MAEPLDQSQRQPLLGDDEDANTTPFAASASCPISTKNLTVAVDDCADVSAVPHCTGSVCSEEGPPSIWTEAYKLSIMAIPVSTLEALSFSTHLLTMAQVGRLGAEQLSAFSLSESCYNITGLSIITGLASGMQTFCGQAFGAQEYEFVGLTLQRALLITLLTCIPCMLLWTQAEWLLVLVGEPSGLAHLTWQFMMISSPSLMLAAVDFCLCYYCDSQGLVMPYTAVVVLQLIITPLFNYLFIYKLDMGLNGAAVSYVTVCVILLLAMAAVVHLVHVHQRRHGYCTWDGWSWECLEGWGQYCEIAAPATAMVVLDWCAFELLVVLAGLLPNAEVALSCMGICFETHSLVFFALEGLEVAVTTRVSNELGAGHAHTAAFSAWLTVALALCVSSLSFLVLMWCGRPWSSLYSKNAAVLDEIMTCMPFLCMSLVGDSVNVVVQGALKGAGRQNLGVWVTMPIVLGLNLPLAWVLGVTLGGGTKGLWQAMAVGSVVQGIIMVAAMARLDWGMEAQRAKEMLEEMLGDDETEAPLTPSIMPLAASLSSPLAITRTGTGSRALAKLGLMGTSPPQNRAPSPLRMRTSQSGHSVQVNRATASRTASTQSVATAPT